MRYINICIYIHTHMLICDLVWAWKDVLMGILIPRVINVNAFLVRTAAAQRKCI